ncbi:MAG: hypothetical protein ACE5E7_08945 [Anaerolineae bacterium]
MTVQTGEISKLLSPIPTVEQLDIPAGLVQDIIFRLMFNEGDANVARIVDVLGVHPRVVDELMGRLKHEHLVEITRAGSLGSMSFTYGLTEAGVKRARDAFGRSHYVGRLPVSLEAYTRAVRLQSHGAKRITPEQVKAALSHLILPDNFHRRIGPAANSGSSLFLYGPPGNGKSTIAQAIADILSQEEAIWLPDAITVGGQIIRIIDPHVHEPIREEEVPRHTTDFALHGHTGKLKVDNRWRLFKRPALMVGGELTMEALDLRLEPVSKVYEAPLQLKANGGIFIIDDFGRQQISPQQLLNRWIVPLETGIDFLRLQSGQSLEVPFDQLIVFSTNLNPMDLVDEAFLRRIQTKVAVTPPDERLFYQIFTRVCRTYDVPFDKKSFIYLLQKWYREPGRAMQAVHPRDLVKTVLSICAYENILARLTPELIDEACMSYFVDADLTGRQPPADAVMGVHTNGVNGAKAAVANGRA